jgi:hypothetical protein
MLTERLAAAPGTLPLPSQEGATPARDEFHASASPRRMRHCRMRWSTASVGGARRYLRSRHLASSRRLPDGETVAVNTGFVQNTMQDRPQQDRAVGRLVTGRPVQLTGYIRFPESAGALTSPETVAKRLWFTRDHLAMARALGWGEGGNAVAPFYVDLEQPVPDSGIPKPPVVGPPQGRSSTIRHHLVHAGVRGRHRIRRLVARSAPYLASLPLPLPIRARGKLAGTFVPDDHWASPR